MREARDGRRSRDGAGKETEAKEGDSKQEQRIVNNAWRRKEDKYRAEREESTDSSVFITEPGGGAAD